MAQAIWKDYIIDLGTTDGVTYTVYDYEDNTGNIIYTGKAYKRPGETNVYVKVNDICADYLAQRFPASLTAHTFESVNLRNKFSLYVGTTKIDDFSLVLNWAYDDFSSSYDPSDYTPHAPVHTRIDAGMPVIFTILKKRAVGALTLAEYEPISGALNDYTNDVAMPGNYITVARALTSGETGYELNIDDSTTDLTFHVGPLCHPYALYYVNELGGWDMLVMDGKAVKTDTYSRRTISRAYDNRTRSARGTDNYMTEVGRTWALHTGWLTDAEASRMHHLLGSTRVYLCDVADGFAMLPVILTNADCVYKTYRNDGMIDYAINVELAQSMIRR